MREFVLVSFCFIMTFPVLWGACSPSVKQPDDVITIPLGAEPQGRSTASFRAAKKRDFKVQEVTIEPDHSARKTQKK